MSVSLVYSTRAYVGRAARRRSGAEDQFKALLITIGVDRARAPLDEAASWARAFGVGT